MHNSVDQRVEFILGGRCGKEAQFICHYIRNELPTLTELVSCEQYDVIYSGFVKTCMDYYRSVKRSNSMSPTHNQENIEPSCYAKTSHSDKIETLTEKLKTPLAQRSNYNRVTSKQLLNKEPASTQDLDDSSRNKKRTAFVAEISILEEEDDGEEHSESETEQKQEKKSLKVKLFKADVKLSKKPLEKNETVNQGSNDNNDLLSAGENQDPKNPSKKLKLHAEDGKKLKKSKQKSSEILTDTEEGEEAKTTKKKSSKKKKPITRQKKLTEEEQEDVNTTCVEVDEPHAEVANAKKSKKNKKKEAKSEQIIEQAPEVPTTTTAKLIKKKSSDLKSALNILNSKTPSRLDSNYKYLKTPGTTNQKRLSRVKLIQSTVKNSVKQKRPLTRRAVAEAAAAAAVIEAKKPKVNFPVSVKKTNPPNPVVNNPSSVKKLINKYEAISKTPSQAKKNLSKDLQNTISRIKTIRNSIDQRKLRHSQAKLEAKRKSVKKAQQFLQQSMVYTAAIKKSNIINETITQLDSEEDDEHSDSATTPKAETNQIDQGVATSDRLTILADSVTEQQLLQLKSSSPKIVMSKIPIGLINTANAISASNASAIVAEQQRRLANTQSQQQFKSLSTALVKMTPSKPSIYHLQPTTSNNLAVPNTGGIKRNSFIKFLERNTPSKLSKTELEEKRKIELILKEQKEKERLLEQEKLKQEKRDETKKKRDEKLLKMKEMKQKQDLEMEKKRKEADARLQQSAVKPAQTNATINLHKSVLLNSTKQVLPQIPQSASVAALTASTTTTMVKKPFIVLDQLKTQPPASKKQSTAFNDKQAMEDFTNDFKSFKKVSQQLSCAYDAPENKPFQNKFKDTTNFANYESHHHQQHNLETTYVLNSPSSSGKSVTASHTEFTVAHTNYAVTPLQPLKLKNIDNYDVSNLGSEDDTDDDEEPSKPIPEWAQPANLIAKVKMQNTMMINFTRLFKSASQTEINLEKIFKTRRKKFTERSSSANWNCPPVWKGNGLTGEESFMEFRKF